MGSTMIIIISSILTITILYFVVKTFLFRLRFLKGSDKIRGNIVEVKTGYNDDDDKVFYPKVKYSDNKGEIKFFEPRIDHFKNDFEIGQEIELLGDENGNIVVNSFLSIWGKVVILILLLLALIAITIAILTNFTSGLDAISPT